MTIEISHETETRLADEARRRGVSVDTLLRHFIDERVALTHSHRLAPTCRSGILAAPELCIAATSTTMSVEPGLADTNVLIYALDADAPHHTAARALLGQRATDSRRSM
jgi:hypothetical protein